MNFFPYIKIILINLKNIKKMSTTIFSSNEKLKLDKFPLNYSNSNINIKNSIIKNNNTMKTIKNSENLYPIKQLHYKKIVI